jgi:L-lysine exporter family protein LysE/ArgO
MDVQAAFLHGLALALALILPLGPQNTFVLSQGVVAGRFRDTWPVVVAAAVSDTLLIGSAVAGVSLVLLALPVLRTVLAAAGVVFLVVIGWRTWTAADESGAGRQRAPAATSGRVRYALSVSLLNPHAILDTVVVIGGGAAVYAAPAEKWVYAVGAAMVSWLWFLVLAGAGRAFGRLVASPGGRRWLNRASAVIMWAVAVRVGVLVVRQAIGG